MEPKWEKDFATLKSRQSFKKIKVGFNDLLIKSAKPQVEVAWLYIRYIKLLTITLNKSIKWLIILSVVIIITVIINKILKHIALQFNNITVIIILNYYDKLL